VQTTAHAIEPLVMSLDGVIGSAQSTAKLLPAVAPKGAPGQWSYDESRTDPSIATAAPAATSPADRVLAGAVYRVAKKDGSVEYTNIPPADAKGHDVTRLFSYIATCMACNLNSPIHWNSVRLNVSDYADAIRSASLEFGVDEALVRAIIHAESAFNPRAMSLKGAQGLMQLMPATANDMGVMDAFDPVQNIRGGARYLALLIKNFNGDPRLVAAAYNAGPAAVQHYNGVPPYAETQVYVVRVGELLQRYKAALHPPLAQQGPG
jgi:soluble lytic murein transglycosylase-like protein